MTHDETVERSVALAKYLEASFRAAQLLIDGLGGDGFAVGQTANALAYFTTYILQTCIPAEAVEEAEEVYMKQARTMMEANIWASGQLTKAGDVAETEG